MISAVKYSNNDSFENDVLKEKMPVLVYFYSEDCPPCIALTPIFERMAQRYFEHMKFVKVSRQQNNALCEKFSIKISPTLLVFNDGVEVCSRLLGYISSPELKTVIESVLGGNCVRKDRVKVYSDVLILGGGPAGLSAAIYAARAKLMTIVVDEGFLGGQVTNTFNVANYPGTNGVIRGMDLIENMKKQALEFGTQIDDMKAILEVNLDSELKFVKTEDTDYHAKSVIIATGAEPKKLPAEGEREYRGRGVHYCATCDGALYQDANVLVIGGGNSAVEEAVFLTRYAKHVTIVHHGDTFQASMGAQNEAFKNQNVSVVWNSEVRKINGDSFVKGVTVENIVNKERSEIEADGLFVYIGSKPRTEFFKGKLFLNDFGYIITDEDMKTNIDGVFAAGDVREKKIRQIATAVNDGVVSGIMAERFINGK